MSTTQTRSVLSVSFFIISLLGVAYLLAFWLFIDATTAVARSALFVLAMVAAHFVGYRLYVAQDGNARHERIFDFTRVRPHASIIAVTQLPCLLLSAMLLDGGKGFRVCLASVIAHWLIIGLMASANRTEMNSLEEFAVRWGFFPCLAFVAFAST